MNKDKKLLTNIQEALRDKMGKSYLEINVEVENGYVRLHGIVDTLAEREYAAEVVRDVPYVKGVDNGLTIAIDNFHEDDEIEHKVLEKFMNESDLDIKKIGVECDKGTIILRGQASTLGEVELAKELAAQVHGVREVRTLVKFSDDVQGVDDSSIVNGVELAFATSRMVEAEDINTSCHKGVVTLEGIVDNNEQKEAAIYIAKTVPGVRKVVEKLRMRHDHEYGDGYLTNKLRRALNEENRVSPAQVKVYVVNEIAYLSGKVYSVDAKKVAEEVAYQTKGIKRVVNDITIAYH
ncbi:MAG: BON domain-containing protein [Peptococcales bacterium]